MPAIDLARLRKQAARLTDFFFLPNEFMMHLREILDFYVNNTLRTKENISPGSNLKTYRTPNAVLTHIENELRTVAEANPHFALELADILWDEGALETRLLAAYLLGRIPPQEERLLPRITAWTQQIRDSDVRSALLTTSLSRMRKETPNQFFSLVREYLHPERSRSWSNGIQALLPMIGDTSNTNLPIILDIIEPIVEEAPSTLQNDLSDLIVALYRASANETTFMLKHVLANSENPMTAITIRRISSGFPPSLQNEIKDLLRPQPAKVVKPVEEITDFIVEPIQVIETTVKLKKPRKKKVPSGTDVEVIESTIPVDSEATFIRKPRKKKTEEISASADVKTVIRKKVKDG